MIVNYDRNRVIGAFQLMVSIKKSQGLDYDLLLWDELLHVILKAVPGVTADTLKLIGKDIKDQLVRDGVIHFVPSKKLNKKGKHTALYALGPSKSRDYSDFDSAFDAL